MHRIAATIALTVALTATGATVAHADTTTKRDAIGDAAPIFDITKATYRNDAATVSARITVPDLQRRGMARLVLGYPAPSDTSLVAEVRIQADGTLTKSFYYAAVAGPGQPRECRVTAKWNAAKGSIFISVPQTCVTLFGGENLYVATIVGKTTGADMDFSPPAFHLARD